MHMCVCVFVSAATHICSPYLHVRYELDYISVMERIFASYSYSIQSLRSKDSWAEGKTNPLECSSSVLCADFYQWDKSPRLQAPMRHECGVIKIQSYEKNWIVVSFVSLRALFFFFFETFFFLLSYSLSVNKQIVWNHNEHNAYVCHLLPFQFYCSSNKWYSIEPRGWMSGCSSGTKRETERKMCVNSSVIVSAFKCVLNLLV